MKKEEKKEDDMVEAYSFMEYDNLKDLIIAHHMNSENYKLMKLDFEKQVNDCLLLTDWDYVNEERKIKGLPKISNQTMKDAYIQNHLEEDKRKLLKAELDYKYTLDMVRFSLEYSFDAIR